KVTRTVTSFCMAKVTRKTTSTTPTKISPSPDANLHSPVECKPRQVVHLCRASFTNIPISSFIRLCGQTSACERRVGAALTLTKRTCQQRFKPFYHTLPADRGYILTRLPSYLVQSLQLTTELSS